MKLGRLPRARNPTVPHLSALLAGAPQPAAPSSVDYTKGLPSDLGMMLNNSLGDCAEAGYGHFLQVDSFLARGAILTLADAYIERLYQTQGYVPGNPSTDQGTILQSLLSLLVTTGMVMPDGTTQKLFAFVEVDPRNDADLNLVTYQCGGLYLGFAVPRYLEAEFSPGSTWDVKPSGDQTIVGGHCVVSAGYSPAPIGFLRQIISWGSADYHMAPAFWTLRVDEAYALLSPEAITRNGGTFAGLTVAEWEQQMEAIKG